MRVDGEQRVTNTELFFDLVYVFAVTQLTKVLGEDLTWQGALRTALLFFAIWWAWIYTAWVTNWLHPDASAVDQRAREPVVRQHRERERQCVHLVRERARLPADPVAQRRHL